MAGRRRIAFAFAGLSPAAFLLIAAAPASASCVAPTLAVAPASGAAGTVVHVSGSYWAGDCNDTGGPPPPPETVLLFFVQGGSRQLLGTTTASDTYELAFDARIPTAADPGPAHVEAEGKHVGSVRAAFTVTAPAGPSSLPITGPGGVAAVTLAGLCAVGAGVALAHAGRRRTFSA